MYAKYTQRLHRKIYEKLQTKIFRLAYYRFLTSCPHVIFTERFFQNVKCRKMRSIFEPSKMKKEIYIRRESTLFFYVEMLRLKMQKRFPHVSQTLCFQTVFLKCINVNCISGYSVFQFCWICNLDFFSELKNQNYNFLLINKILILIRFEYIIQNSKRTYFIFRT